MLETPRDAAAVLTEVHQDVHEQLDRIRAVEAQRVRVEVQAGRRPAYAGSASEIDFAAAVLALDSGFSSGTIAAWLLRVRPEKETSYSARTVQAAQNYCDERGSALQCHR